MNVLSVNASVAETAVQPDYIALAMMAALIVTVLIMALRKWSMQKKKAMSDKAEIAEEPIAKRVAPGSTGCVDIHDVDPRTAAMLMAIVADKMQKPLGELRFISIREVK